MGHSFSIDEAAVTLGVTRRTIYYRIQSGLLMTIRVGPGQRVTAASMADEIGRAGRRLGFARPQKTNPV